MAESIVALERILESIPAAMAAHAAFSAVDFF